MTLALTSTMKKTPHNSTNKLFCSQFYKFTLIICSDVEGWDQGRLLIFPGLGLITYDSAIVARS